MKTLLLFAVLALSINAFAQSKRTTQFLKCPSTNSAEGIKSRMMDAGLKTYSINSGINIGKTFQYKRTSDFTSIQVLDSLYSWSWDTVTDGWKLNYRINKLVYDESNNPINYIEQNWDGSAWVNLGQYTSTYDANHNMTSEFSKIWTNNTWINEYMFIWTFDANNNETSALIKQWSGAEWTNTEQTIRVFDANNNLTSEVSQMWTGSMWENSSKITNIYDANNNLLSELNQGWNGSDWDNANKESYTYDGNNNKLTSLSQMWLGSDWLDLMKSTYTYDANNNLINELSKSWNFFTWENNTNIDYTYDSNNNLISELEQEWDGSEWVNSSKSVLTYDGNKNPTSVFSQFWDGSMWLNSMEFRFGYTTDNFVEFTVFKIWDIDGITIFLGDSTYMYSHTEVTGIPGLRTDNLAVYPNPSNGKFTINGSTINVVEIYNITGKRIYTDTGINNQTLNEIDLTDYPKGVYIIKVFDGRRNYSRKLVIQ